MAESELNTKSTETTTSNEATEPQRETRYHQLAFVQYERNPKTDEDLNFNELNIIRAIGHRTITKYAYAKHDKDTKVAGMTEHPDIAIGDPIPAHWQGAIYSKHGVEISTLAKWLGIPEFLIRVLHGRDAFIDYVGYLPHDDEKQQTLGKHLYDDDEIKANFNWRADVNVLRRRQKDKDLLYLSQKEYYRHKVLFDGMSLRQIFEENSDAYREDYKTLEKNRLHYLKNFAPLPPARVNYYITGRGGLGKGLLSRALARNLFPNLTKDDDIFFEVGASNVTFEGYDGQPCLIWSDARAITLLHALGNRENVFNVFDTHPVNARQHVKHDSIRLTNQVNIVNSVDNFTAFLDGLAGEYKEKDGTIRHAEDKGQSYRRFPIVISLHEEDFDLLLNKGVLKRTAEFEKYVAHNHIRGNLQKIYSHLSAYEQQLKEVVSKVVAPIVDNHFSVLESLTGYTDENLDDILASFADYGTQDVEACKADERARYETFIKEQTEISNYDITYLYNDTERYQRALEVQDLLTNNPEELYQREDLHLKPSVFMGAYRG